MSVGANIKKRRMELRMSQQELADAMGYKSRSTIAKIEADENDVTQKKLHKFAQVLDTTVEFLMSGYRETNVIPKFSIALSSFSSPKQNKNVAVILAGGNSGRNLHSIPSQFIDIQGKPIIVYCMDAYQAHPAVNDIYVVCLKGWENIVKAYAEQYGIDKLRGLIPAGKSGIASLNNAVEYLRNCYSSDDTVIIQEATRPQITVETISKLLQAYNETGSATICHTMRDYVQFDISEQAVKYVDRDNLIALQSPEAHNLQLLMDVFDQAKRMKHSFTETCFTMLLYHLGYTINFVKSDVNNIKIVREEDIAIFKAVASTINN